MTLDEILPEIRKGRKFTRKGWGKHYSLQEARDFKLVDMMYLDDFELEPLPKSKLKAWIGSYGNVCVAPDGNPPTGGAWVRAPWLDER